MFARLSSLLKREKFLTVPVIMRGGTSVTLRGAKTVSVTKSAGYNIEWHEGL